jgi:hypothetical protein
MKFGGMSEEKRANRLEGKHPEISCILEDWMLATLKMECDDYFEC